MDQSSKKTLALSFLEELARMRPDRLQEVIRGAVGEELAAVMFGYAQKVMRANPDKAIENGSSLVILGYLIRVHEEGLIPSENLPV